MAVQPTISADNAAVPIHVGIEGPPDCPVAVASEQAQATATNVGECSRSIQTGEIVGEFTLDNGTHVDEEFERIREGERGAVYRFVRQDDNRCACGLIEEFGLPVTNVSAEAGTLYLTFHARPNTAREVLRRLSATYESVSVRHPRTDPTDAAFALVDMSELTDRQYEVLERAYEMGYFDFPKGANAGEVAADLDIARSTFSEHLSAAQRKLLRTVFD